MSFTPAVIFSSLPPSLHDLLCQGGTGGFAYVQPLCGFLPETQREREIKREREEERERESVAHVGARAPGLVPCDGRKEVEEEEQEEEEEEASD